MLKKFTDVTFILLQIHKWKYLKEFRIQVFQAEWWPARQKPIGWWPCQTVSCMPWGRGQRLTSCWRPRGTFWRPLMIFFVLPGLFATSIACDWLCSSIGEMPLISRNEEHVINISKSGHHSWIFYLDDEIKNSCFHLTKHRRPSLCSWKVPPIPN